MVDSAPIHVEYSTIETVLDHNQEPVVGVLPELVDSTNPHGRSFEWSATEVGGGAYRIAFTPTIVGTWTLLLVWHATTGDLFYEVEVNAENQLNNRHVNVAQVATVPMFKEYHQLELVVDYNNLPLIGVIPTEISSADPNGRPFTWSYTDLGDGSYRFSWYPDLPGTWTLYVSFSSPTGDLLYAISCVASGPVYIDQAGSISLRDLRAMVARQLSDYRKVVATEGSINTVTDPFALVDNTDHFRGAEMICISGHVDNEGKVRKVTSSSYENYTLSFIPDLPQPVVAGDSFELFNHGRTNRRIQEYNDAINDAIRQAHPQNREKIYMDLPAGSYSSDQNGVEIPPDFVAIYGVQFNYGGSWYNVPPGRFMGEGGWTIDRARRLLVVGPGYGHEVRNAALRLYGYTRAPQLLNDTDMTSTDPEWIIDTAVGSLIVSGLDQATYAVGQSRNNRADQLRGKMVKIPEPNVVTL